ncbi:MAG: lyase family protein, partial [Holophaga sp.]|nr:lyase family protein [Holophaga sp.]
NSRGRHEGALADWLASVASVLEKALWDLILFSTEEFHFVTLPDAFTTGSSIMPQKRNPDVLELSRATCRLLRGQANLLHEVASGLPSSYHRDVQLLKAPVLEILKNASDMFAVLPALLNGLIIEAEPCLAACSRELYAAHAATALAVDGMPFRDAYRTVAAQVMAGNFAPEPDIYTGAICTDLATPAALLRDHQKNLHATRTHWQQCLANVWESPNHLELP